MNAPNRDMELVSATLPVGGRNGLLAHMELWSGNRGVLDDLVLVPVEQTGPSPIGWGVLGYLPVTAWRLDLRGGSLRDGLGNGRGPLHARPEGESPP